MDGGIGGEEGNDGKNTNRVARPTIFPDLVAAARGESLRWESFRDGIEISRLYDHPDGPSAAFLRYAPGARLQRHEHRGYEHIFVLTGSQSDDHGEYRAGAMLVHPPGTSHAIASASGCVVLAIWERPVLFQPDERLEAQPTPPVRLGR